MLKSIKEMPTLTETTETDYTFCATFYQPMNGPSQVPDGIQSPLIDDDGATYHWAGSALIVSIEETYSRGAGQRYKKHVYIKTYPPVL